MSSDTSSTSTTAPLLRSRQSSTASRPSTFSLLISRAVSTSQSRGGAPMLVRQSAARELEERRADWGFSKPVVALDIMWNLAFVIVSVVMLICTANENPNVPIRVWVCGYALQCLVHVVLVWVEYNRRSSGQEMNGAEAGSREEVNQSENEEEDDGRSGPFGVPTGSRVKRCESVNTMASFLWWIVGFYWVVSGGEILLRGAPRLYWLAVVFLAFDVIFAIFCVVLACLIGIALCCCLPCIIAILYAVAGQEGASDADLSILPKYRFLTCKDEDRVGFAAGRMIPIETSTGYMTDERNLLPEDAISILSLYLLFLYIYQFEIQNLEQKTVSECCICLCAYEDETDLHALPCTHHFHSTCITKWLKMNATCPLCKYNILKGNDHV